MHLSFVAPTSIVAGGAAAWHLTIARLHGLKTPFCEDLFNTAGLHFACKLYRIASAMPRFWLTRLAMSLQ